jgi:hypothetical protein
MPLLDVPAYRQNQAPLVIVVATAAGRPGHFVATLNGTALITASKTPMCAACRGLLAEGFDPDAIVVLKHAYSPTVCLTAKLGVAAGLTLKDRDHGRPTFERWQSMPPSFPVEPPMRQTPTARIHGHDDGHEAPGGQVGNGHTAQARPPDLTITAMSKGQLVASRCVVRPAERADHSGPRRVAGHCPRKSSL